MRFTVGKKLLIFNLLMLVFMIVIGFAGFNGMKKINHENSALGDQWIPQIADLGSTNFAIQRLVTLENSYVISATAAERKEVKEEIDHHRDSLEALFKNYESLIKTDTQRDLLEKLRADMGNYLQIQDRVLSATDQNDMDAARKFLNEGKELYPIMDESLYSLILFSNDNLDQSNNLGYEAYKAGTTQTLLFIVISIIASIIAIFYLNKVIVKPITELNLFAKEVALGNLTEHVYVKSNDEIKDLSVSLQTMSTHLREVIISINGETSEILSFVHNLTDTAESSTRSSSQIATTMGELAQGTEDQAVSTNTVSEKMIEFSRAIHRYSKNGASLNNEASEIRNMADQGFEQMGETTKQMKEINEVVHESVDKMAKLDRNYQEVSKLVETIQTIAEQTNLLALNAAIEAARAGEQGLGFSVVAGEVRKLSEQVAGSVVEIHRITQLVQAESAEVSRLLENSYRKVEAGSEKIQQSNDTFQLINQSVVHIQNNIKNSTEELISISEAANNINTSIESIAAISEESAVGIEETAKVSELSSDAMRSLSGDSTALVLLIEKLRESVSKFKV